ncbi:hypothetical protein GCM10022206_84370 [Streptomyces chiangmaiensis]
MPRFGHSRCRVTRREHLRRSENAQELIHSQSPAPVSLAGDEPGERAGRHPGRPDHGGGGEEFTVRELDLAVGDPLDRRAQTQLDSEITQGRANVRARAFAQLGTESVGALHQNNAYVIGVAGHFAQSGGQFRRCLQTGEARSDDDRGEASGRRRVLRQASHVVVEGRGGVQGIHVEDPLGAGDRRAHELTAGGQHQSVIAQHGIAATSVDCGHRPGGGVDVGDGRGDPPHSDRTEHTVERYPLPLWIGFVEPRTDYKVIAAADHCHLQLRPRHAVGACRTYGGGGAPHTGKPTTNNQDIFHLDSPPQRTRGHAAREKGSVAPKRLANMCRHGGSATWRRVPAESSLADVQAEARSPTRHPCRSHIWILSIQIPIRQNVHPMPGKGTSRFNGGGESPLETALTSAFCTDMRC